jgi:hexokinase
MRALLEKTTLSEIRMINCVLVLMEGVVNFFLFQSISSDTFLFKHSLVEHYPNFVKTLRESLRKLVGEDVESRVEIGLAKDGSGVGGKILEVPHLCY